MKRAVYRFTIIKGSVYWLGTPAEINVAKDVLAKEYGEIKVKYHSDLYETTNPNWVLNNPDAVLTPVGIFNKDYRY